MYPDKPIVGVGSLVLRGGRILLIKRARPPGRGLWSIPGGHVELGEPLLEAAARELEEEAGLKGRPLGVVNVDEIITVEGGRVKYHYVLITVLVDAPEGDPRPGGDAVDAGFFHIEQAKHMEITPSTRGLIDKIVRGLVNVGSPIPVLTHSPRD